MTQRRILLHMILSTLERISELNKMGHQLRSNKDLSDEERNAKMKPIAEELVVHFVILEPAGQFARKEFQASSPLIDWLDNEMARLRKEGAFNKSSCECSGCKP